MKPLHRNNPISTLRARMLVFLWDNLPEEYFAIESIETEIKEGAFGQALAYKRLFK